MCGIPWVMPDWKWWLGVLAVGLLGFIGQVISTIGFTMVPAGRGALALYVAVENGVIALCCPRRLTKDLLRR